MSVDPQARDEADFLTRVLRTGAYELLAPATGLAVLVITDNLGSQQVHNIAATRLYEMLETRHNRPNCGSPKS